jgi:hypothetical protein
VTFTYPFFGQEEELKGVEEASLKICFDPLSFYAFIDFELDENAQLLKEPLQKKLTDMMPAGNKIPSFVRNLFKRWLDIRLESIQQNGA